MKSNIKGKKKRNIKTKIHSHSTKRKSEKRMGADKKREKSIER